MRSRRGPAVAVVVAVFWLLGGGIALPIATGQSPGTGEAPVGLLASDNPPAPAASAGPSPPPANPANPAKVDDLLNLDLDQLSKVHVSTASQATNLNAPSNQITSGDFDFHGAATTGELAEQAPSVSTVKLSAINLDPRVRGYNSSQLNASANGMTEVKTRLDIDSAFEPDRSGHRRPAYRDRRSVQLVVRAGLRLYGHGAASHAALCRRARGAPPDDPGVRQQRPDRSTTAIPPSAAAPIGVSAPATASARPTTTSAAARIPTHFLRPTRNGTTFFR